MKITYLKLKNFIGIYNGLGRKEIELDLTKGSNSITLLVGTNGSGKSTIMSTLHPFHGTFDDKTNIILPNHDGYKEIHIETEKGLYVIQHYYSNKKKTKSVKSFIQLNGNELNENGGVKTFEEIIKNELDLVPSFMTLSNIGSNTQNFIDKKSTDRKKAINEFLPDIEEFLHYYKIINDKWSVCRKEIKSVSDQLAKLDNIEHLNSLEISTINQIKHYEDLINLESKHCTEYEYELKKLDPDGSIREKFKDLATEYQELNLELEELRNIEFGKYQSLDDVKTAKNKIEIKRNTITDRIINNKSKLEDSKKRLITNKDSLEEKENILSKYVMEKDLSEYKEIKLEYELEINRLNDELEDYDDSYHKYDKLTLEELNTYSSKFNEIEEAIKGLLERTNIETIEKATIEFANNYNDVSKALRKNKEEIKNELEQAKEKRSELLANVHHAETLDKRPKSCKDDECPFIKIALKYANLDRQLEKQENLINVLESSYEKVNNELDEVVNIYNTYRDISSINNMIKYNNLISLIVNIESINDFILGNRDKYRDITSINDYVGLLEDIKKYKGLLDEVNKNIEILEDKQVLIDTLENDIDKLNIEIDELNTLIVELGTKIVDDESKINTLNDLEEKLEEADVHFTLLEEKENRFQELKDSIKEIEDVVKNIKMNNRLLKETKEKVNEYKEAKEPYDKELDRIKIAKNKIEEYTKTKTDLDSKFNKLNIVRDALNPTKGIPLLFINTYLTKTKLIANKLLDVAFKGKFQIEEFEVTEKDFFIKLRKESGELVPDIGYASQGEKALVSVAISMALIQQSMRKYNILLLDEIDAELDVNNRRAFIEILESQFEMLGIEQCFLITHNNEFDTYNTDLILMKNHNVDTNNSAYMNNKTIIFEA